MSEYLLLSNCLMALLGWYSSAFAHTI